MDAFPKEYVEHNLPLILLSGLSDQRAKQPESLPPAAQANGTQIRLSCAPCVGDKASVLLDQFLQFDGSSLAWNPTSLPGPVGSMRYAIKAIGRTYTLPPRKAAPMAQPTSIDSFENSGNSPPRSTELHSPLSPLSPASPVFPDGVFTPLWFVKHQQHVPSLLIAFFDLYASAPGDQDERIKADINAARAALTRSGFRTKFTAVLISDRSVVQNPGLEDRINAIRRSTGLDSKSGLFFMPPMNSQAETATFVQGMIKTLQPLCVEFYRDLTKHARRKKARSSTVSSPTSPTGGSSPALSVSAWYARYEIKQGVFAEFRQEMDVAERHYTAAVEELLGPEGVLEYMQTWSPRWNESRLLCDCMALRILRCHLWNSATAVAANWWTVYRARVKSLIDRRGKGSQTYSWAAWEARWAESMAQLILRADLPVFKEILRRQGDVDEPSSWQMYATSERPTTPAERLPPFRNLHHPGYWLRMATKSSQLRRQKAHEIPEEDRVPPGQSPASMILKRSKSYDLYLALEPHEESPLSDSSNHNHLAECTALATRAADQFDLRSQSRMADQLKLEIARDLVSASSYEDAIRYLVPLWESQTWRNEHWTDLFRSALLLLRQCAIRTDRADIALATTYELLSVGQGEPEKSPLALADALDELKDSPSEPVALTFHNRERSSPVSASFAFESKDASVGEPLGCQLLLVSNMDACSRPLEVSNITISFDNSRVVKIINDPDANDTGELVDLTNGTQLSDMHTNLTMKSGERRIFNFSMTFKEARNVRVTDITIAMTTDRFTITHVFNDEALISSDSILVPTETGLVRRHLKESEPAVVSVSPKPPKVRIVVNGQKKRYYTDEQIRLAVEIVNGEDEPVEGSITARLDGDRDGASLSWLNTAEPQTDDHSAAIDIPQLAPGKLHRIELVVKAPRRAHKLPMELVVDYTVSSDTAAAIRKTAALEMNFILPLEATFNFGPMLHAKPWKSYFDSDLGSPKDSPGGILQLWGLRTQLHSIAADSVIVHSANLQLGNVIGESRAYVEAHEDTKQPIEPNGRHPYFFELYTQKFSLDDRRATAIESTLEVVWSRDQNSDPVTTQLAVPRLSLPVSEPRVLCTINDDEDSDDTSPMKLSYWIENPSTHFLTFALTMEASNDFAFSGPKYQTLSLAPLSRHRVEYVLVLQDALEAHPPSTSASASAEQWIWPVLQVVDSYYQKTLRVLPGGLNVKLDEKQNIGVRVDRR